MTLASKHSKKIIEIDWDIGNPNKIFRTHENTFRAHENINNIIFSFSKIKKPRKSPKHRNHA